MQEALLKLFSTGDSSQTAALIIILGITFLLGALVWAVLAHFPSVRKLKKVNKELETENVFLKKENTDLSERYTVINAKLNRSTEDLQTAEANLKEKSEKVEAQLHKIKLLSEDLVLYKDNARNFKESNEKLMEQYTNLAEEHKRAIEQVEGMKGIVEDVENEKKELVQKFRNSNAAFGDSNEKLISITESLAKANETVSFLKKDLEAALSQRAEMRKMLQDLEAVAAFPVTDDTDLRTQVVGLKTHVRELEEENNDLMNRIAPYLAKELQERRQEEELDELLVNLLVEAEHSMAKGAFYTDIHEDELIDDKKYLDKALTELVEPAALLAENRPVIKLTDADHAIFDQAFQHVATAMKLQGFYADVETAVLVDYKEASLTDDELMDKHLEDAGKNIDNSFFYNQESTQEGFVDQPELLKTALAQMTIQEPTIIDSEKTCLEDHDHKALDEALDAASIAMGEEGLYSPIDSTKLIGNYEEEDDLPIHQEFESELEKLVIQEIGRSISIASIENKNDLKKIDGIGMFVEQRLNHFGIYTYLQISQFDPTFIAKLGAALGFSEQSIVRDRWVEQAKELM